MKQKQIDEREFTKLREKLLILEKLSVFSGTEYGKFFVEFLEKEINECTTEEDKKNIYELDSSARDIFFVAVRSKRQTLKALRDKIANSPIEFKRLSHEIELIKE